MTRHTAVLDAPTRPAATGRDGGHARATLSDYAAFVVRHRVVLALALVLALPVAALVHGAKAPQYVAVSGVVLVMSAPTTATARDVSIDSAAEQLRSDPVIGHVARTLPYPGRSRALREDLTVRPVVNSRLVRLVVGGPDPVSARDAADALAERFLEVRRASLDRAVANRRETVEAQLGVLQRELDGSAHQVGSSVTTERQATTARRLLLEQNAVLSAERSALQVVEPDPGYVAEPAELPRRAVRTGLDLTVGSTLALALVGTLAACAALDHVRAARARPAADPEGGSS